jgi:signal recognition particle receptor subunit beta
MATILAPQKASGAIERAIYFREINKGTVFIVSGTKTQKSDETAKKIVEEFRAFAKRENIGPGKCEVIPLGLAWMTD